MFQIFSEVSVMFSIGGRYYTGDPIVYSYMEDKIFEQPRNITIKLHHRIGKFVKLRFSFASRWIMISEVTFDSGELLRTSSTIFSTSTICLRSPNRKFEVVTTHLSTRIYLTRHDFFGKNV